MWKIVTAAIPVFLLLGNAINTQGCVSSQDYIPKEFWRDGDAVTKVLQMVVPKAQEELKGIRYEGATDGHLALAEKIMEETYPYMKIYMEKQHLTATIFEEFSTSIGLYIVPGFDELSDDEKQKILDEAPQYKTPATYRDYVNHGYAFLDYVGGLLGKELY
jgi:hypothetical protein